MRGGAGDFPRFRQGARWWEPLGLRLSCCCATAASQRGAAACKRHERGSCRLGVRTSYIVIHDRDRKASLAASGARSEALIDTCSHQGFP
eukprot:6207649-Pleurochrysis_carterae.AAC.2